MDVQINYDYREDDLKDMPLVELAQFVLNHQHKPENTEVSLSFVTDDEIANLNETYRGKVGPTDVLSFECDGVVDELSDIVPEGFDDVYELGDVVIAPDVAERQTHEFGTTFEQEISLLFVHGLLHLCGYDHIVEEEAQVMERLRTRSSKPGTAVKPCPPTKRSLSCARPTRKGRASATSLALRSQTQDAALPKPCAASATCASTPLRRYCHRTRLRAAHRRDVVACRHRVHRHDVRA